MATIFDLLDNAEYNARNVERNPALVKDILPLAIGQLELAVGLLAKGYSPDNDADELLDKYGELDDVPDKPESAFRLRFYE